MYETTKSNDNLIFLALQSRSWPRPTESHHIERDLSEKRSLQLRKNGKCISLNPIPSSRSLKYKNLLYNFL